MARDMDLVRIARRVASPSRRVSLETVLETVQESCPTELKQDIGSFLGRGAYGEAYEVDGGDKVLKISVAKDEGEAERILDRVRSIEALDQDVFTRVFDYGILCDVDMPGSKYMVKSGTAYFYVMEKLKPIPDGERKIAVRAIHDLSDMEKLPGPQKEKERKKYLFSKERLHRREGDIEEGGSNPLAKAADLYDRMMEAGVGHRDIHGGNLMQDADGRYKLIDLESARLALPPGTSRTVMPASQARRQQSS